MADYLIKNQYVPSKYIKVFPCSYRGLYENALTGQKYAFDPESRLLSEANLRNLPGNVGGRDSYIIDYTSDKTLKCVIGGYYFEIYQIELSDLVQGDNPRFLYIKTVNVPLKENDDGAINIDSDRKTTRLASFSSDSADLDDNDGGQSDYYFTGLVCRLASQAPEYTAMLQPVIIKDGEPVLNKDARLPILYSGNGTPSVRINNTVSADGQYSLAQGISTKASGVGAHAEGQLANAKADYSHAEGYDTTANGKWSHTEGLNATTTANGEYAHAEGEKTEAQKKASHAEGYITKARGDYAHTEGFRTEATAEAAHAEGLGLDDATKTIASGRGAHAEGESTRANAVASHTEGKNTQVDANYAHTEGIDTLATGEGAHAEGHYTEARGAYSHAEGEGTNQNPRKRVIASGHGAHAEGKWTEASGANSHAEGNGTTASNDAAHSEGLNTTASGKYSHAEGKETVASGDYSHAGGIGTKASREGQTTVGKYNKEDDGEFIVGIGTGNAANSRKNAVVVNGATTKICNTLEVKNDSGTTTFTTSPDQTNITTATNNISGATNTIDGTASTSINVNKVEKVKVEATTTTLKNTALNTSATTTSIKCGDTEKIGITTDTTTISGTTVAVKNSEDHKIEINNTATNIYGKVNILGNAVTTGSITSRDGNIIIGDGTGKNCAITYADKFESKQVLALRTSALDPDGNPANGATTTANWGCGLILGGDGTTVIKGGEAGTTNDYFTNTITNWNNEKIYLVADGGIELKSNTQEGASKAKTWYFNNDGTLVCPGPINGRIAYTVTNGDASDVVNITMGNNDVFRIRGYGKDDVSYLEIATADNGNEAIHFRQYQYKENESPWAVVAHEFTALDTDGKTKANDLVVNESFNFANNKVYFNKTNTSASGTFNVNNKMCIHDTGYIYTQDSIKADENIEALKTIKAKTFNATSDARLKENIKKFEPSKSILDLPVYKYDFIDGPKNQIGCLAQDLEEICPEIVDKDKDGYLTIQESKLVYLLLEEVKALKAEIKELKNK